ncbi:hypothetical protein ACA910_010334 [Epithemia clementina (nom. ined.)]
MLWQLNKSKSFTGICNKCVDHREPSCLLSDDEDNKTERTAKSTSSSSVSSSSSSLSASLHHEARRTYAGEKRVRFDEHKNKYYKGGAAKDRHVRECWYKSEDYRQFKDSANEVVLLLAQSESVSDNSYRRVLSTVFMACCKIDTNLDSYRHLKVSLLREKDRLDLEKSVSNSNTRFGLEHWTVDILSEDRRLRRRQLVTRVYEIQRETKNLPSQFQAALIRRNIESITRPSRLFALEMAQALAAQ